MRYVYILQSITKPDEFCTGSTGNFKERLKVHNAGSSPHTSKHIPWQPLVVIFFADDKRANEFERYLKSGSGRAFALKHFR